MAIWTIATRTFLHNLYDFRFLVALVLVLGVMGISAFLSVSQMAERQRAYSQLRHIAWETANLESVKLVRRPALLSFLYDGGEDELPRYLIVTADFVDYPIEEISTRVVVEPFVRLDWVFIVVYFYSLLTILLTFDLISGQRELRTLSMILAQPVSRGALLLGSYFGTLLTLLPALLIGFLIYLLATDLSGVGISWGDDGLRLLLALLLSLLFVSAIALIGVLASASFEKSSASLTAAFLVWVLLTVVVPNASKLTARSLVSAPSFKELQTRIGTARAEYQTNLARFWSMDIAQIVNHPGLTRQQREQKLAEFQAGILQRNLQAITKYKSSLRRLRAEYLGRHASRAALIHRLEMLSPSAIYKHAVEAVIGTGQAHLVIFTKAAENYMHAYTRYAAQKQEELKDRARFNEFVMEESGYRVRSVSWIDYGQVEFDRSSMPKFEDPGVSLLQGLDLALVDFALLIFLILFLFVLTYRRLLYCPVT
jgi:ABC-type transport system involved in multi-copper enzyme maturation permease subunit